MDLISAWCVVRGYHGTGAHLLDLDIEWHPLNAQRDRLGENPLRSLRTIEAHRLLPSLQPQRTDKPDDAQEMIGVKVREEDLGQRKAHPVAHHLALGALAALEQQRLAFAHESESADVPLDGGPSGART